MSRVFTKLTPETTRLEWLRYRQAGIGGSDAAAVLGLSRWKGPIDVWLDKTREITQEDGASVAAYWGNVLEDIVAQEFSKRTGLQVRRRNAILMHDAHDFILANIDRELVGQKVGLECKTASSYKKEEWSEDEIPAEYIVQCQHYMAVTGYESWWIACLIGGNQFVYKQIERDEELIEMLLAAEVDFWNRYVAGRTMPPVDGSFAAQNALKVMYPQAEQGEELTLDAEQEALLQERQDLVKLADDCDAKIMAIDNQIKADMGTRELATGQYFSVKWGNVSRTTVDSKRLKAEAPEIYQQYSKTNTSRTFRVKEIG